MIEPFFALDSSGMKVFPPDSVSVPVLCGTLYPATYPALSIVLFTYDVAARGTDGKEALYDNGSDAV